MVSFLLWGFAESQNLPYKTVRINAKYKKRHGLVGEFSRRDVQQAVLPSETLTLFLEVWRSYNTVFTRYTQGA